LNAQLGYLDTEITAGQSIDPFDRTQGDPTLHYAKSLEGAYFTPCRSLISPHAGRRFHAMPVGHFT